MIICSTYDNLDVTGSAFNAQFQLRHKCFIERQTYNVRCYNGKEYDQYDTPAAVYLVYQSNAGTALGASRLTPTVHQCMLKDLWPEMVSNETSICSENIWEGTRFCIDKKVDALLRKRITHELVLAYLEFGLMKGITHIVGLMPKLILRSVFRASGVVFEELGPPMKIDGVYAQAAIMEINTKQLTRVRNLAKVYTPVLSEANTEKVWRAA